MTIRLTIDTLIALTAVALLAGIVAHQRHTKDQSQACGTVQRALHALHEEIVYRAAVGGTEVSRAGHPVAVSPEWFKFAVVPTNTIVPGDHPWVDVAPDGDLSYHPPDPVITRPDQAGFWYNPNRGVFRARVMPQETDRRTAALYNRLNATDVASVLGRADGKYQPQPNAFAHRSHDDESVETASQPVDPADALTRLLAIERATSRER